MTDYRVTYDYDPATKVLEVTLYVKGSPFVTRTITDPERVKEILEFLGVNP